VATRKKCFESNFVAYILFTDEATFMRNGITNFHYTTLIGIENLHAFIQKYQKYWLSLNIWIGIIRDHLIESIILPNQMLLISIFLINTLF